MRTTRVFLFCVISAGCTPPQLVLDSHLLPNNQASITGQSYSTDPNRIRDEIAEAALSVCPGAAVVRSEINPPHVHRMGVDSAYAAVIQCPPK